MDAEFRRVNLDSVLSVVAGSEPDMGGLGIASFITQVYSTGVNNISVTSNNTSGSAHRTVQPTFGVNVFVRIF
jgi:hypothetical protein